MPLEIREVDPHDETELRAWWEVGDAATAERPGKPWPEWEKSRVALPTHNPERGISLLSAMEDGRAVGSGLLTRSLQDNLHAATAFVYVLPERCREGIGTALAGELEVLAARDGRTTMQSEAYLPPGGSAPAAGFATALGYAVASRESVKELSMTDYAARRAAAVGEVDGAADDYRIVTFDTVCPEEHLASFGQLMSKLMGEIPLGDLDLEDSEWTPERLRAEEGRWVTIGRHVLMALAIAPDGSVAGSSDVRIDDSDTTHGQVGVTLVDPAHMNAVNDALGYRSIETLLELQKKL